MLKRVLLIAAVMFLLPALSYAKTKVTLYSTDGKVVKVWVLTGKKEAASVFYGENRVKFHTDSGEFVEINGGIVVTESSALD